MWYILIIALLASLAPGCTQQPAPPGPPAAPEFAAFLPEWERAQTRFINGDPDLWKQNASHTDDATIFGAFGGLEKGWNQVGERYDWAASQFRNGAAGQQIEYLNRIASGELAVTVAIERQQAQIEGQETLKSRALRVTQVFRREGGRWRLLHRHADPLVERLPPEERR